MNFTNERLGKIKNGAIYPFLMVFIFSSMSLVAGAFHLIEREEAPFIIKYLLPITATSVFFGGILRFLLAVVRNEASGGAGKFLGFVFLSLLFSMGLGLIRGFPPERVAVDVVALFIPVLLYAAITNIRLDAERIRTLADVLCRAYVVLYAVYTAYMFYLYKVVSLAFNLTFGSPLLAFVMLFLIHQRSYIFGSAAFMLAIASGKRSIIILTLLCLFGYFLLRIWNDKKWRVRVLLILPVALAFAGLAYEIVPIERLLEVNPYLNKLTYLNVFSESYDSYSFGTGRAEEIFSAIDDAREYDGFFILGTGAGFSYLYEVEHLKYEAVRNNLHVTPVSFLIKFGPLFAFVFYLYLVSTLRRGLLYVRANHDSLLVPLTIYLAVYTLFYSLTAYAFVADYSFWTLFGIFSALMSSVTRATLAGPCEGNVTMDTSLESSYERRLST